MKNNVFNTTMAILGMIVLVFATSHRGGNGFASGGDKGNGIISMKFHLHNRRIK